MTTSEKCEVIVKKLLERANEIGPHPQTHIDMIIGISKDWGGNTATFWTVRKSDYEHVHTHVGVPDGTWEEFVDGLYSAVTGGPGLSYA